MSDVLIELMAGVPCDSMKEEFEYMVPMYVLSNKSKLNGSGCIFYHNLLHSLCEKLECDLYILPSSIHEVILIPAYDHDSYDELTSMVKRSQFYPVIQRRDLIRSCLLFIPVRLVRFLCDHFYVTLFKIGKFFV